MPSAVPDAAFVERFADGVRGLKSAAATRHDCDASDPATRFGLAVSGGPDSLALLLLAHAWMPGRVAAATFDHGLRAASAGEADHVAAICGQLGVPHTILRPRQPLEPRSGSSLQTVARESRYQALGRWCGHNGLRWLLTAHHADDQAETVLMRLARGTGPTGLSGIRPVLELTAHITSGPLVPEGLDNHRMWPHRYWVGRPLLHFAKAELMALVSACGIEAIDDPSNRDTRYDRTHARKLLQKTDWLDPLRLSQVSHNMRDADAALAWAAAKEWEARHHLDDEDAVVFDPTDLPAELLRRCCEEALWIMEEYATGGGQTPHHTGPELTRFIDMLLTGGTATLGHVMAKGGKTWRFTDAPPRRSA